MRGLFNNYFGFGQAFNFFAKFNQYVFFFTAIKLISPNR